MAVIFPIPTFPSPTPIASLGGARRRAKPLIGIHVVGPGGDTSDQVLVDPGADDVVFPLPLAATLGVNLSSAPQRQAGGVGAPASAPLLYATVILELRTAAKACRWRAVVAFTPAWMRFSLFGIAGGLQYFRTTFDFEALELTLDPKPSLPTTTDPLP
jgi:hypothetical protein